MAVSEIPHYVVLWASIKGHYEIAAALAKQTKFEGEESCAFKEFLRHKNKDGIMHCSMPLRAAIDPSLIYCWMKG